MKLFLVVNVSISDRQLCDLYKFSNRYYPYTEFGGTKNEKNKTIKKQSKRSSRKRLAIKIALLVTLTAFLSVVAYGSFCKKKLSDAADRAYEELDDRKKSDLRDEAVEPLKDNVSILFIGVDESELRNQSDSNSRSDALLVATLNNKDKSVKLVSIPRDSYVYIPDRGRNR